MLEYAAEKFYVPILPSISYWTRYTTALQVLRHNRNNAVNNKKSELMLMRRATASV